MTQAAVRDRVGSGRQRCSALAGARGFTLVELLVVVVLLAILATFAVLAVRGRDVRALADEEAQRLVALLGLAKEESLFRYRSRGVWFYRDGYDFRDFVDGGWQTTDDPLFRERAMPEGVEFRLYLEGRPVVLEVEDAADAVGRDADEAADEFVPQLVFFPDGMAIPFELVVEADGAAVRNLKGNTGGVIEIEQIDGLK